MIRGSESHAKDADERPLVSIVIAARNPHPPWLDVAIASAFAEPDCRIQLILVDDGSTLPVKPRLESSVSRDIRVVRIPAGGVSRARNIGVELSSGDYVRFLDSDDALISGSTSRLLHLARNSAIISYGTTVLCGPDLVPFRRMRSRVEGLAHLETALGRFDVTLPALLFPREVLLRAGPFDESLEMQEDWDLVLRATEVAPVAGTSEDVYLYRQHGQSSSSIPDAKPAAVRATVAILRGYLERHPELAGKRSGRLIRAYAQFHIARLRGPAFPLRSARFRRAALVDPVRAAEIVARRSAYLAYLRTKDWLLRRSGLP